MTSRVWPRVKNDKRPPTGGRQVWLGVSGRGRSLACWPAIGQRGQAAGGGFAVVRVSNTSAYVMTPGFLGRPRFLGGVVLGRCANECARRRLVLATAKATSTPVLMRPVTLMVPRRRFSHASLWCRRIGGCNSLTAWGYRFPNRRI